MRCSNHLLTAVSAAMMLVACSGEDVVMPGDAGYDDDAGVTYIKLNVSAMSVSRANPSGGEDGDGLEAGIRDENTIYDLSLFFYSDPEGKGPNADGTTLITHAEYFDNLSLEVPAEGTPVSHLFSVREYFPGVNDRAIVAVNLGHKIEATGMTLEMLRDMLVTQPWTPGSDVTRYTRFTMASASNTDGVVNTAGLSGDREHPYEVSVSVERTAARIDLMFNDNNIAADNSELVYGVDAVYDRGAKVHVTHVLPVNAMSSPTYLLKRVTVAAPVGPTDFGNVVICGDEETADGSDIPVNYVVEPTTAAKGGTLADGILATYYGNTAAGAITDAYFTAGNAIGDWLSVPQLLLPCGETGFSRMMTLMYTNENTQHLSLHDSRFITGLVIKAVYEPAAVYSSATVVDADKVAYTRGMDLWQYRPTSQTMDGLCYYFTTEAAAKAYRAAHDHGASVTYFKNGVCYYNVWLRHANDKVSDPHKTCPMEYAIVRNNIYRVGFSFTGIGTDIPEMRDPNNIVTRIFTRKWKFRQQPEVVM